MHAVSALRSVDATVYGVVLTMVPTKGPDAYYYGYNYKYDAAQQPSETIRGVSPRAPQQVTTAEPSKLASSPAEVQKAEPSAPLPTESRGSVDPARSSTRAVVPGGEDDNPVDYFSV
jgi:non-specific protein-tyrosine kinase